MAFNPFRPKPSRDLAVRIKHIEDHLANLSLDPATLEQLLAAGSGFGGGGGGGSTIRLPLPEAQVAWDPTEGHTHDGTEFEGAQIDHANLLNVTADQHHAQAHLLLNSASDHSDSDTGLTMATGDLIYRNSGAKWTRLAIGTAGYILRVVAGIPAWVELNFNIIVGTITATQHGNLTSTAGTTADHDGTLNANARVAVKKNGTLVATRRGVNFIEGSNVTLTVVDDSGNEEVDVTIAQTSVSAATIIVQEGDSTVVAACDTVDFAAGDFDLTEDPSGEANVAWHGFAVEEGNVETAGDIKRLDFGAGFDTSASGGEAEINLDLSEVVTGDVVFTGNAGEVQKLWGLALEEPVAAKDMKGLAWDEDNLTAKWWARDFILHGWSRADISNAGTSYGIMPHPGANGTNIIAPFVPYLQGYLRGIAVSYDGNVDPTTDSHTVTVFKNGVATALTVTVTGANAKGTAAVDVSFAANDEIDVRDLRTGAISVVGCHVWLFGVWDE